MRDTDQIHRKKMPKHHHYFHLRLLSFERVWHLPLSLKIFHYCRRQQGSLSVVKVSLLSMISRAPGKSGKMLLCNHRTWYKVERVSRLATVFLSCLQSTFISVSFFFTVNFWLLYRRKRIAHAVQLFVEKAIKMKITWKTQPVGQIMETQLQLPP